MGKRIRFVVDEPGGSRWYRAEIPAGALRAKGHDASVATRLDRAMVSGLDVIVFHRQFQPGALAAMEDAAAQGKLTVLDIDDDYWDIPVTNPAYPRWRDPDMLHGLEACVRAAGLVTTPSSVLARSLSALNPRVVVLPNMLRAEDWPAPAGHDTRQPLVVGWGGSPSHIPDLSLVAGVVEQVVASDPRVEFRSHGLRQTPFTPSERVRVLPGAPLPEYPSLVRSFDVGLAPLQDTRFNRCKSDLKALEYAAAGACIVASRVAPYEESVRHGETGLLVGPSAKDWLKALRRVTGDTALRESMVAAARRWAETRFIERDENVGLWETAYAL